MRLYLLILSVWLLSLPVGTASAADATPPKRDASQPAGRSAACGFRPFRRRARDEAAGRRAASRAAGQGRLQHHRSGAGRIPDLDQRGLGPIRGLWRRGIGVDGQGAETDQLPARDDPAPQFQRRAFLPHRKGNAERTVLHRPALLLATGRGRRSRRSPSAGRRVPGVGAVEFMARRDPGSPTSRHRGV